MADLEIIGPVQGTFLCCLSQELASTKVHIATTQEGAGFYVLPGENIKQSLTTSGKDQFFFLKMAQNTMGPTLEKCTTSHTESAFLPPEDPKLKTTKLRTPMLESFNIESTETEHDVPYIRNTSHKDTMPKRHTVGDTPQFLSQELPKVKKISKQRPMLERHTIGDTSQFVSPQMSESKKISHKEHILERCTIGEDPQFVLPEKSNSKKISHKAPILESCRISNTSRFVLPDIPDKDIISDLQQLDFPKTQVLKKMSKPQVTIEPNIKVLINNEVQIFQPKNDKIALKKMLFVIECLLDEIKSSPGTQLIDIQDLIDEVYSAIAKFESRGLELWKKLQGAVTSQESKLLSVHPHPLDKSFGLNKLRKKVGIQESDLDLEETDFVQIALQWPMVIKALANENFTNLVHSVNEIFSMNESSSKAFAAFSMLSNMPGIESKAKDLIEVLKNLLQDKNYSVTCNSFEDHRFIDPIFLSRKQIDIFQRNYFLILERLLPMRALQLQSAIETVYKASGENMMMAATYHVIEKYSAYNITDFDSLYKLLDNEKLIFSVEELQESFLSDYSVEFELVFCPQGKSKSQIRSAILNVLERVTISDNLILWLNQEYKRKQSDYKWTLLTDPIQKEEIRCVEVNLGDTWYGGDLHHQIKLVFSHKESYGEDEERLIQLKNFFQLALANIHHIIPSEGEFILNGDIWQIRDELGLNPNIQIALMPKLREAYNAIESNAKILENTANLFQELGNEGVAFNTTEKILKLLKDENKHDVDNLCVQIADIVDKNDNTLLVTNSGPLFLWPCKDQRICELSEDIRGRIKNILQDEFTKPNVHPDLLKTCLKTSEWISTEKAEEIMTEMSGTRGKLQLIIKEMCLKNKTVFDLIDGLDKVVKETELDSIKSSGKTMEQGMKTIIEELEKLQKTVKLYPKSIDTLDNFIDYVKRRDDGNAFKFYPKMSREDFFIKLDENKIKPGDMIMMWRQRFGIQYAHAGIFLRVKGSSERYIIHVQLERYLRVLLRYFATHDTAICCSTLKEALLPDDKIFVVRRCQTQEDQNVVLRRAMKCLYPKLQFKYNGYYGSCQTFCNRIFDIQTLMELNLEANYCKPNQNSIKSFFGNMLDNKPNALNLIRKMEERFLEDHDQLLWRGASLRDSTRRMRPKTEHTETDEVDGAVNNDDILYDECTDTFVIERSSKINLIP